MWFIVCCAERDETTADRLHHVVSVCWSEAFHRWLISTGFPFYGPSSMDIPGLFRWHCYLNSCSVEPRYSRWAAGGCGHRAAAGHLVLLVNVGLMEAIKSFPRKGALTAMTGACCLFSPQPATHRQNTWVGIYWYEWYIDKYFSYILERYIDGIYSGKLRRKECSLMCYYNG